MTEDCMMAIAVVLTMLLVLTIALVLVYRQTRSALKDNAKLLEDNAKLLKDNSKLASEVLELKKEAQEHQRILDELRELIGANDQTPIILEEPQPQREIPQNPKNMSDEELGAWIDQQITEKHLFCDPDLNLKSIAQQLGVTQKRIKELLKASPHYNRLYEFLTEKRIQYACELLRENPQWSVDIVSREAGFVSRTTFQAEFKKRMGVTPAKYRFNNS